MVPDSLQCAFLKIPKANDISSWNQFFFIALQVDYGVMHL